MTAESRTERTVRDAAVDRDTWDRNVAFASTLLFAILFALDGWLTSVGLALGAHELGAIASVIIGNFGVGGFVLLKISVSLSVLFAAFVLFRTWAKRSDTFQWMYLVASVASVGGAILPVMNNLVALRIL